MISMILLVFAFVLFCLGAYGVSAGRWNLISAGLAFWVASLLFGGFVK